jgi:hypothetical protein
LKGIKIYIYGKTLITFFALKLLFPFILIIIKSDKNGKVMAGKLKLIQNFKTKMAKKVDGCRNG